MLFWLLTLVCQLEVSVNRYDCTRCAFLVVSIIIIILLLLYLVEEVHPQYL